MKKILSLLLTASMAAGLAACGGHDNSPEGKRKQLEELRKDQSRIAAQIAQLEGEVGAGGAPADTAVSASEKAKTVEVKTVAAQAFAHYVDVQGEVESNSVVFVNARQPGIIDKVSVREGDHVAKGQVLATTDAAILRNSMEEIKTQLTLAETVYEKQKGLWDQKIGSEIQYINAKANRDALRNRLTTTQTQLSQTTIVAPVAGTVDQVFAKEGAAAVSGVPMFRIVNLTDLKVVAPVSESYLADIHKGAPVVLELPDLNKKINTTLTFVSSVVDPVTRSVDVEVRLQAAEGIRPNMLARLKINDQNLAKTVVIDQNIVQTSENGQQVFVAVDKGGKLVAEPRKVQTGLSYNGQVQITTGLKPGDKLITQGYQDVSDGQVIKI